MAGRTKVKVVYAGPNAKGDPRTLSVTPEEAERLVKHGNYKLLKRKTTATTTTTEKEADNG